MQSLRPVRSAVSVIIIQSSIVTAIGFSLLPIGAKKVGFDPAVMASPFLTTIVDTLTLLVYFGIATLFLGI